MRDYEPRQALDGGTDGLAAYREIAPVLARYLKHNGVALLEIGADQHHMVVKILEADGLTVARIAPDLAGQPAAWWFGRLSLRATLVEKRGWKPGGDSIRSRTVGQRDPRPKAPGVRSGRWAAEAQSSAGPEMEDELNRM